MNVAAGAGSRSVVKATLAAIIGFAILVSLGVWQLERKTWKENLIAQLNARLATAPQTLPQPSQWPSFKQVDDEFRRVAIEAEFVRGERALVYTAGSALRPDVSGPGYWVFAPARVPGGIIVVNRGFIPDARKDAPADEPKGTTKIVGVLRWPEQAGLFTPAADPQHGLWYARDHNAMAAAKQWGPVAPFYIDQEMPNAPGGPSAGRLVVHLPDNHLQYAITWFGLALALAGVYLVWLRGRWRAKP